MQDTVELALVHLGGITCLRLKTFSGNQMRQSIMQISYMKKLLTLTIQASMELAKEKGAYPLFEGSEWQTGDYFETERIRFEKVERPASLKLRQMVFETAI